MFTGECVHAHIDSTKLLLSVRKHRASARWLVNLQGKQTDRFTLRFLLMRLCWQDVIICALPRRRTQEQDDVFAPTIFHTQCTFSLRLLRSALH